MKDNTFRFLRYRDEIKQKVVVSFKNSCPDNDESLDSYFAAAVEKWTDSSASEQFAAFRTRVAPYILSLKLIIFHQDFLCRELKVLWEQLNDNCLAPVLDLVANLACDIREDFFSHIDEFLPLIVGAIIRNAKDAELLGHCFTCVTHLVYFLHRPMLKNIEKVLKFFLPLLSHGSSLVPQFTAECLAFLFRKFEDKHRLLRILENVIENAECLGIILSEMLLGAGGKVHTTSLENLPFLFDTLFELRCEDKKTKNVVSDEQEKKEDFAAMDYDTKQIGFFVDVPFPKFVVAVSHSLSQLVERSPSSEQIGYVIHHLTILFRHLLNIHSAQYFREYLLLLTGFLMSLTKSDFMPLFEEDIGKILTMLIDHYSSPHVVNLCCIFLHSVSGRYNPFDFMRSVIQSKTQDLSSKFEFLRSLTDWQYFDRDVGPHVAGLLSDIHRCRMVECVSPSSVCVFSFLFQMSMYRGLVVEEPSFLCLDADGNFFSIDCTQTLISGDDCKGIIDWFVSPLCTVVAQQSNEHRKCCGCSVEFQVSNWVALFCLPHIRPLPLERISEMLFQAIPILMNSLPDFNKSDTDIQLLDDDNKECILHLLAVSEAIYKIRSTTNQNLYNGKVFPHQMTFNKLIRIAAELSNGDSGFCCIILRVIDILVHVFILDCFFDDDHVFLHEYLQSIQRYLVPLLSCYSHQIRLHILRILSVIYGKLKNLEDNVCDNTQGVTTSYHSSPVYNVIERCLKAERIKLGPQTARDFLMHILQLHADHDVKSCSQAAEIALRYLFGLLHVQFTAIWPSVYEAISSYCEGITYTHKQKSASIISSVSGDDSVDTVTNQLTTDAKNWSIECKNLFWSLFKPLLLDVETKIVSNVDTVKDLQQKSSNSTLENIYSCSCETAIIWFTSIRPDLHSLLRKTTRNDRLSIEPRKPPDWIAYRLCLWQCLRWKGASKNTRFLTPLLLNTISSALQFGVNKSSEQLLLIILDLYSQFTNIKSIYMEKEFKEAIHHLLKFKQPTIQKAAFKCILAYKQPSINNYQEQIEQIIDLQTFRDTVRTFRLDTSLFSSEHREQISGVLLRILYGRLQLSKGQFASAIFTNLALCTDSELNLFLSFLLDPLIKESEAMSTINFTDNKLNESIQCIRQRVENTIYGKDSLSWPRLHALSKIINQALMYMGHRLNIVNLTDNETVSIDTDNIIQLNNVHSSNSVSQNLHNIQRADILLRLSLCLLTMVYEVKRIKSESNNTNNRLPLPSQMKAVRCAGNSLIIHLFSSKWLCEIEFWNNNHSDNDILKRSTCVKQVCCNPFVLNDILTTSCLSINHLLIQLGSLWSSSSSYLVDEFFEKPLVQTFLILLNNHYCGTRKLNNNVIEKLVEIIHNLVFLPDVCSKGRRLLFPFHSKVVSYLHKRLQELCQVKATFFANLGKQPQSGLRLQREFRLVGYLAQLPHECVVIDECEDYINCLSSTEGEQLLHALLQLLSRSAIRYLHTTTNSTRSTVFKRRALVNSDESAARYDLQLATGEAVEAELIQSILHLIPIISNVSEYLKKVLNLFVCSKSRVARSLLCRVVSISLSRLPNFPLNLFDTLKSLTQSNSTTGQNELTVDSLRYFTMYLSSHNHANDAIVNLTENILIMLNSWDENYIEQPDVNKRVTGFNLLIDLCLLFKLIHPPEQTLILHIAGLNCAIYTICHEDLQLRDISLNYIINVIESIEKRLIYQQLNETDIYYQELIIKCIWHNLVICLRDSSIYLSYKRLHLLRLLNTIIHIHKSRSHFSSLALLIDNHSSNNDFYTNLQSNSLSRQCCAIRRLGLFLHNPITIISRQQLTNHLHSLNQQSKNCPIKQKDLRELFLPILWFYLEPELNCYSETSNSHKLDKHKKLYEYCLDAIGALAKHLHWKSYRILLESVISRLNSCINTNLVSQIIVNLIDAFQPPNWEVFSKSTDEQIKEEEDVNNSNLVHNIPASKILTRKISPENLNILNYMLSVVKRLEPFIVKPIKTKDNTGTSNDNQSTTTSQPLKISLVISLVMLLRRLPDGYLESRLPHLILRVVDILRPSRDINFEVRNEASKSLSRIARLLGPGKGLDKLFEVVTQQLNRGGYTYWQVRLYTLHRVLGEVEQAIISGEVAFKPGQLDNVGRILGRLYLDEIVGRLAEEMDSRRTSAKTLSETYNKGISTSELTEATSTSYLPEANGLKSPEGIARLCRLLSSDGIINLFNDIKIALSCAVSGSVLEQMLNNQSTSVNNLKSSSLSIGCGLRFRHRALARLECTLSRLSTKNAIFSNQYLKSNINTIIKLFQQLVNENLNEILILNENSQLIIDNNSMVINSNKNISRWLQPQSKPLEPRWHYLELENEPIREYNSSITQSGLTQSHLMICCGLHLFIGLIRYHWLKPDNLDHLQLISSMIPSIIICLNSIYVQVLEVAVKCVRLLLLIATSKVTVSRIPKFHEYLNRIGEKLFDILANQPNNSLLSNKISSSNYYGENLASSLYRAFASLVRHQYGYPLSKTQLLTLLNAVDIELDRYAIVSPSLSLLHAIFQRRLRDPSIQTNDENFLNLDIDPEVNKELPVKGLIIARLSDCDHELNTGASGGSRLLDLFNRLQILAITSSSDQIRSEARCCLITFLLNYPHKVKFLQSFIAFCVRQLQYKTSAGRLSAASLLSGLISDLPITRLMGKNHMDEAILLSVGAAIERESDRKSRSTLLNLIRLLFSKLPSDTAQSYFNDYLLAFLTAPSETRCSARLLGLQMIISILDSQSCLSVSKLRNNLISILSNDVLPIAAIQVNKLVLSNPSIMIASGLNEFYNKGSKTKNPKEEYLLNKLIKEDAQWISDLKLETTQSDNEDYAEIAEDVEIMISSDEEMSISNEDDDNDIDLDADTHSDPFTTTITEQQPSDIPDKQQSTSFRKLKASKSAIKNQYFLAAYTMEQSLKLIYYLIGPKVVDETNLNDVNDIETYISSVKLSTFWRILLNGPKYDTILPPITEFQSKKAQITLKKRREQYSTLFSTETITSKSEIKSKKFSLLVTGHRESREWATRCLSLLLKIEVNANKERFVKHVNTLNSESSGINVRSTIFKRLQKGKYGLNKVLQRLLDGLLFQLEVDARVPISEEWSNSIVSNLIYLGQLLHLTVGRKPVLRIFRVANKIALDELNNRPQYYCQRLMALKLITGLLLRLPHPDTNILFDMFSLTKSNDKVNELITDDTLKKKEEVPAYFAYLRSASKLLSREFRQRERLAFIAASSLSTNINDENTDIGARIRLRGNYLSKELTVRAKARRRRAQARLRRALMSGTIRPESAQSLVTSVSAGMAKAGPDQLVDLIESTESALTQELGGGNHQLIQIICTRASLGARIIRERRNLHKATRDALGIAWSGPVKKKLKLDVSPQSSSKGENFNLDTSPSPNQSCKRKRSSNEEHDEEEKIEIKAKKKSRKC